MTVRVVLLHFGGVGAYTAAAVIAAMFAALFALSFIFGRRRKGSRVFSREWVETWVRASLSRLAVAAAFSGALFAASSLAGGGRAATLAERTCQQPTAPFTNSPVTRDRLQGAIAGMRRLAQGAAAGDRDGAPGLFFGTDAHNVTHDIDAPLRQRDAALGKDLCRSMVTLELQLSGDRKMDVVRREAESIAAILERAGAEMGLLP